MQRNIFPFWWPPLPTGPGSAKLFFGKFSKYFQLSKGKNHFFHKSPPLVVLSPKKITCVFSTKRFFLFFMPSLSVMIWTQQGHIKIIAETEIELYNIQYIFTGLIFISWLGGLTFMMHLLVEILINLLISQLKLLLYGNGMANEKNIKVHFFRSRNERNKKGEQEHNK